MGVVMNNFVEMKDAEQVLNTTITAMSVAASVYKKKHDELPSWYVKIQNKIYIDVNSVLKVQRDAANLFKESCDLYYHYIDELQMTESHIARLLAKKSTKYTNTGSWRTFMQLHLFVDSPRSFVKKESRIDEFYKILKENS